jgi:two-component system, NtrC family, response regulator HydG
MKLANMVRASGPPICNLEVGRRDLEKAPRMSWVTNCTTMQPAVLKGGCPMIGRDWSTTQVARHIKLQALPVTKPARVPFSVEPIAKSAGMRAAVKLADRAAQSNVGVLITGESGTGKEVLARYIHEGSRRSGKFVAVNLGALPEGLVESELFGHSRGSFTGATDSRMGLLEAADKGTLFLDEIGDMPLLAQVKLLRVLEDSQVRAVGVESHRSLDLRVIAATHEDLSEQVRKERFRADLFYRIAVLAIHIPPLRTRTEDIQPFITWTLARLGKPHLRIDLEAMGRLMTYPYAGNLRELRNAIERATAVCDEVIRTEHLPALMGGDPILWERLEQTRTLADMNRDYVMDLLVKNGGRRRVTAKMIGVNPSTLYRWLVAWDVIKPDPIRKDFASQRCNRFLKRTEPVMS